MTGRKESVFQMQGSQWTKIWSSEPPPFFVFSTLLKSTLFKRRKESKLIVFWLGNSLATFGVPSRPLWGVAGETSNGLSLDRQKGKTHHKRTPSP